MNARMKWFAALLLLLPACTGSPAQSKRISTATPDPYATFPFPTPSPTVSPRTAPPLKGYVSPPLTVTAHVEPNVNLSIGASVTFTATLRNYGDASVTVPVSVLLPSGVAWEVLTKPPSAQVSQLCSQLNGPACSADEIRWDPSINGGQVLTQTVKVRITDFRCPAKGDFHREATVTVGGPVARGPNGYTYWMFFENDREDYIKAKGSAPEEERNCDVRFAT